MANYLKMQKRQQVLALLELGWTYRPVESETGVPRETVSRYDRLGGQMRPKCSPARRERPNPALPADRLPQTLAKVFPGSGAPARSAAAAYHEAIVEKLELGLTIQRVWQDLVEEYGYAGSYESVKRYIRALPGAIRPAGVIHTAPGEEAKVDFFQGAPTLDADTGQWRRHLAAKRPAR